MASQIGERRRRITRWRERAIETVLFLCAASSVLVTLGIVGVLVVESWAFFSHVPLSTFLTDTMWTPLFSEPRYGILPLLSGTLLSTFVGLCVAAPLGLTAAIYLERIRFSEISRDREADPGIAERRADRRVRLLRAAFRDAAAAGDDPSEPSGL